MKKTISIILCLALTLSMLSACISRTSQPERDKLSIVTTIFPAYDWVKEILGNRFADAEVTMLFDNGVDPHSYQPSAEDIVRISTCDLFIYVGGTSDSWIRDVLEQADSKCSICLFDTLESVKQEEIKEGMEAEDTKTGEVEYDEHVWLSIRNAEVFCSAIAEKLGVLDTAHQAEYIQNGNAYIEKLKRLDTAYQTAIDNAPVKTLLFGDRFAFRYLVDDYKLSYYAAFAGCAAETEASFATVAFLADKIDALGLHAILQQETSDGKLARTVQQTTKSKNQQILTMHSMQSITSADIENGASYLSTMEQNLKTLKAALQ